MFLPLIDKHIISWESWLFWNKSGKKIDNEIDRSPAWYMHDCKGTEKLWNIFTHASPLQGLNRDMVKVRTLSFTPTQLIPRLYSKVYGDRKSIGISWAARTQSVYSGLGIGVISVQSFARDCSGLSKAISPHCGRWFKFGLRECFVFCSSALSNTFATQVLFKFHFLSSTVRQTENSSPGVRDGTTACPNHETRSTHLGRKLYSKWL